MMNELLLTASAVKQSETIQANCTFLFLEIWAVHTFHTSFSP